MEHPKFAELEARIEALEKALKVLGKKGSEQESSSTEAPKKPVATKGTKQ